LEHIAAQETVRRQRSGALFEELAQQAEETDYARQAARQARQIQQTQARQALQEGQAPHAIETNPTAQPRPRANQPSPQEILRRRLERQKDEERRSREFHNRVLSDIFGIPVETQESKVSLILTLYFYLST
jgi:hypothetical protein